MMVCFVALLASGCVTDHQAARNGDEASSESVSDIREVDLSPRYPRQVGSSGAQQADPAAQTYYGESPPVRQKGRGGPVDANGKHDDITGAINPSPRKGYEINFENTPVSTVAKAVLGDILGLPYVIDPRVTATVSLSSARAISREDLPYVLESGLRASNVAMVREGQGYRLIPSADAVGTGGLDPNADPQAGFGVSVVPLEYVSASVVTKLIENFAAKPGMVRADTARNLLLIQGSATDRRTAIDTALNFDADWMRGQSVGIYPINNSTPEPIISELERIIDSGEGGLTQNVVKLQPIARQNAVLAVARTPDLLKRVGVWITRLDRAGGGGTGLKVYRMRYGDAKQVAALLNDIFLGNSGGIDAGTNQLIPGGGAVSSSSGRATSLASSPSTAAAGATAPTPVANAGPLGPSSASGNFASRFGALGGRFSQTGPVGVTGSVASAGAPGSNGAVLANVRIAPDVANNSLLIYANQENYKVIESALRQIDRPQLQVAIDATIAEITLNDNLRYGVQFYLNSKDVGLGADKGSALNSALKTGTDTVLNRVLPGFNFLVGTEAQPRVILDALRSVTQVKVLSTPSLVVLDNQFASLQVGDQIPITTRTAQSVDTSTAPVVNNIEYRNTGVILRVAPRINANGNVLLNVEQEISSVADTINADTLTPTVSERRVESAISVANGQTVLLGGLISEMRQRQRDNVPGAEQLPLFGELLGHRDTSMKRTELIIFIRPQIIRNGIDAARIAQQLRAKMHGFGHARPVPHGPPPVYK
jgi:general secretion pathway protein D